MFRCAEVDAFRTACSDASTDICAWGNKLFALFPVSWLKCPQFRTKWKKAASRSSDEIRPREIFFSRVGYSDSRGLDKSDSSLDVVFALMCGRRHVNANCWFTWESCIVGRTQGLLDGRIILFSHVRELGFGCRTFQLQKSALTSCHARVFSHTAPLNLVRFVWKMISIMRLLEILWKVSKMMTKLVTRSDYQQDKQRHLHHRGNTAMVWVQENCRFKPLSSFSSFRCEKIVSCLCCEVRRVQVPFCRWNWHYTNLNSSNNQKSHSSFC